nr:hypothetical protein [Tanacetum cinerariifolium]
IMGESWSPNRVFNFPADELEPHLAYDFFAPGPLPGHGGQADTGPMIDEVFEPVAEAEEEQMAAPVMDMEEDLAEVNEEWLMAPVTSPLVSAVQLPSVYEVGGPSTAATKGSSFPLPSPGLPIPPSVIEDLSTRLGDLEYEHGQLVKKVIQVVMLRQIGAGWCSGGAGSADCDPKRRGDW